MSETNDQPPPAQISYEDTGSATPMVYFDIVAAHGTMNNVLQIELGSRILAALPDGRVEIKFISTARLRCSPTAAVNLRKAIDEALKMLEDTQPAPQAGQLN